MTFAHPWALLLLVALVPLCWTLARARVPLTSGRRSAFLVVGGTAFGALVVALADPHRDAASPVTRVALVAAGSGANAAAAEAVVAAWRSSVPHADPFLVRDAGPDLGTSLAAALAAVPAGASGEVLLVGTPRTHGGELAPLLAHATQRGIAIHARTLARGDGVRLLQVDLPPACREREVVRLRATTESDVERSATLEVWHDTERLAAQPVRLRPGRCTHLVDVLVPGTGAIVLSTRIVGLADVPAASLEERSALLVEGRPTLLHLASDPARGAALRTTLAPYGFEVTTLHPKELAAPALADAAALLVDDVGQGAWSTEVQQEVRARVETEGLGLLIAGARAGATTGGYSQGPLAALLPLDPSAREERRDPSVGLVIVLDTSGSMGGLRIELAKEVARLALRRLLPHDKAGIVEFYGSRRWAAPLQPAANAIELQRALDRLQAGGGTIIYSALEESFYALLTAKTRYKHVLVLTDGGVESGPFETLARRMAEAGMQVHTVLIGPQGNSPFLQSLAQWGRGRFYACPSRFELPELRFLEPENAPLSSLREGVLTLRRGLATEATSALLGDVLPGVEAWTDAAVREGAAVLLRGSAEEPVLAGWDQGAGRVLVFATDLLAATGGLQRDARYGAFLADALRSLTNRRDAAGRDLVLTPRADRLEIRVEGRSAATASRVRVAVGGREAVLPLLAQSAARRGAEWQWSKSAPGAEAVVVSAETGTTTLRGAAIAPLAPAARGRDVHDEVRRLATLSGGSVEGPVAVSGGRGQRAPRSLAGAFALLGLVAFLATLLVRRWPSAPRPPRAAGVAGSLLLLALFPASPLRAQESAPQGDEARIRAEFATKGSLDELLARTPTSRSLRVATLRAEGRLLGALALLDGDDPETLDEKSRVLEALGRASEARDLVTRALTRTPGTPVEHAALLLRRAELALDAGDKAAASADFRAAGDALPDAAARFRVALLAAGHGLHEVALALAGKEPGATALQDFLRARWCEELGRSADAVGFWEAGAARATLERERRFAWLMVVEAERKAGSLDRLVARWTSATDPIRTELRTRLLRELGRAEEALAALQKGTETGEDLREMLLVAAEAGRAQEADRMVLARLAAKPGDLDTLRAFVIALVDRGDLAKAEAAIAAALPSATSRTLLALADTAAEVNLPRTFRACLDALVAKGSSADHLEAAVLEASALRTARKPEEAARVLLAARERHTAPAERARLAEQLESLGKLEEALTLWREVYQATKAEDVGLHLAWLLSESEQPARRSEALAIYEKVWLGAGAEARRKAAQSRVLDTAAREGTLAELVVRLEKELADPNTEGRETKRQALLEIYARAKDSAGAEAALQKELADPERVVDAKLALARVYVECGELGRYARTLEELRSLDPKNELDYTQQLAYAALERGRPAEARALVRELTSREGPLPEAARELAAGVLALSGKPKEAVATYRKALANHPERIETWLLLGGAMQKAGRTVEAHGVFCDLLLAEPPDDLLLVAVDGLLNLDAPPNLLRFAERTLRRRIAAKPDKVYLLRALQDVLEETKDEAGRLRALADTLLVAGEQRGSFVRELLEEAKARSDREGVARAARLLLALGDEIPPAVLVEAGQGLVAVRDFAAAERAFERARFSSELSAVEGKIVAAYDAAGRTHEAERILRRALRRDPDDLEKTLDLARLLERRGEPAEALAIALRLAVAQVATNLPAAPAGTAPSSGTTGIPMSGTPGPLRVLPNVARLPSRNQDRERSGPSYEDLRALALRCSTRGEDLAPLTEAVARLGQEVPKKALDAAYELRILAAALQDRTLAARALALEDAVLAGTPTPADRRTVTSARLLSGDLEAARRSLDPEAKGFDRDRLKILLSSGDTEAAATLARSAPAAERSFAALGLYLSGADAAARTIVAEPETTTRARRGSGGPLARLQRALGLTPPPEPGLEARLEEIAALPTPIAKVVQTSALVRAHPELSAERRAAILRPLLPLFADDAVARLGASFLEVSRGALAPAELGEIAKKALLGTQNRSLLGNTLSALEAVPATDRAEVLDKLLEKLTPEDRDTQILLALQQADGLGTATKTALVAKLSGKPLAPASRTWFLQLACEPTLDPAIATALATKVTDSKDPLVALLQAKAAGTAADRHAAAERGLALLVTTDSAAGLPWRVAEQLVSRLEPAALPQLLATTTGTRFGERFVRAALHTQLGKEMEAVSELAEALRSRPGEGALLNLVLTRAAALGDHEKVFRALSEYAASTPAIYSFQAASLATQLLERGEAEQALAILRRVEVGGPPLRSELRAIAALPDRERRMGEGRRLLQDTRSSPLRFFVPNDPAQLPPTLAEALAPARFEVLPTTPEGVGRALSDWAALALHPEGGTLARARLRVLTPAERTFALELAFARVCEARRQGTLPALEAEIAASLAANPLAPDALALAAVAGVGAGAAGADTPAPALRRLALLVALADGSPSLQLAQLALLAAESGDRAFADRLGRLLLADRDGLVASDLRALLPELVARFGTDPERLLALAPREATTSPDLDAALLRALVQSPVDPDRIHAAFRTIDETQGRLRLRTEGLLLPWLGVHLRRGDDTAVRSVLERLVAPAEGADTGVPQNYAAAIPPLALWRDPTGVARCEQLLVGAFSAPAIPARMVAMRLAGMLAQRYAEAGKSAEAAALRARLAERFGAVPSAASWIRGTP